MKSLRKFAAVLLTSSGLALTVSLIAQGNSAGAGKSANAGNKSPITNQPINPNPSPHDPTVSAVPAEPKPGSGMTPGAANSGSGVGGRETVAPPSATPANPANASHRPPVVGAASAPGFIALDTDRDGRISITEFASPSASWLRAGAPGVNNDRVTDKASPPVAAPGSRDVKDRPLPPGYSGAMSGSNSATTNAQLFQQIDTDHDGYVSAAELDAYRMPATSER